MNVLETIKTRRSIRKYKPKGIPEKDLKEILKAAQLAPSAGNKQPWRFVVVRDSETKNKLGIIARNQTWISDAGVIVAALSVGEDAPEIYPRWVEKDVMTAVEHMVLASWSLGYGTCWIGAFKEEEVKPLLGIPEDMKVICLLPIGVPAVSPDARGRMLFDELFYGDRYGKPLEL